MKKNSDSRSRKQRLTAVGNRFADLDPLYPQKLALTSPTGGGRSVGIVRVRTKATEFYCDRTDILNIQRVERSRRAVLDTQSFAVQAMDS